LTRNGTKIVKFFLNVSKDEQRKRFLERIHDPHKQWKFSITDVAERQHWGEYMDAYEEMFENTSTKWAPWYIIPADHKWVARSLVARILAGSIESLQLQYPKVTEKHRQSLEDARAQLEGEHQGKNKKSK
jgi:polyphosphate kinase 2 (PPK2 family)